MEDNRSALFCAELLEAPVILDPYNRTPVVDIAEELMGKGNVLPVVSAKPYPRFPLPPGEGAPEPRGHIDGNGNGTNGMAKGVYRRGFTAFAVICLADLLEPNAGNFTVWPKSHRAYQGFIKEVGHEILASGMPRIDMPEGPMMVTAYAGDLILARHQMLHTGGPNASPNGRHAVIARLRHKDVAEINDDAYTDVWREWPGMAEVVRSQMETA